MKFKDLGELSPDDWKRQITEMFEFEQTIREGLREVRIVMPNLDDLPLESYKVKGEEARRRIVKFVCAMSATYLKLAGYPQLEVLIYQISKAIAGPDESCEICEECETDQNKRG